MRLWWLLKDLVTGEIFRGKNSDDVVAKVAASGGNVSAAQNAVDTGNANNSYEPSYTTEQC